MGTRRFAWVAPVVAASCVIGWGVGWLIAGDEPSPKTTKPAGDGSSSKATKPAAAPKAKRPPRFGFHMGLKLDDERDSGPGVPGLLKVRGVIEIGDAKKSRPGFPDQVDYDVILLVRDANRRVVAHDVIGRWTDRVGVWGRSDEYTAAYRLPRGMYICTMYLRHPKQEAIDLDDKQEPAMGGAQVRLTVR